MKASKALIVAALLSSCSPTPFKDKPKTDQLTEIKLNVMDYCSEKLKSSDLAVNNFMIAYHRERDGLKSAATLSPYDNIQFLDGKKDSVELTLSMPNSYKSYTKNKKGHPIYSTGLHFKIDGNGKVTGHTGYVLYYGDQEQYVNLTGNNSNLLYNSFKD
jgi:hypothetical protein